MAKNVNEIVDQLTVKTPQKPTFDKKEQDARYKAGKRYISEGDPNTVMKGWYSLMGRPSGYNSNFRTYDEAWKRLQEEEALETERRNAIIDSFYDQNVSNEDFMNKLLGEFLGNKNKAMKWFIENGRRFK